MRIRLVDRPGLAESAVRIGLVGPARDQPDVLPLQLVDYLLGGGGPTSRLAQSLRVVSGLSYDARSSYAILRDAGLLSLGTAARNDSVVVIIRRMRGELARLAAEAPGEAELAAARHYFQNSYVLQFETLGALLTQWTALDFYGLSYDSLDRYVESAGDVTAARVHEVASRWLDPARLAVVVVGPGSVLEKPLEALGPVEVVTGEVVPPAPAAALPTPATPEQKKHGRELLGRALAAHGGAEALRHVDDSTVEGEMVMRMGGNDLTLHMRQVRKNPLRFKFATRMASTENGQILDGTQGWNYSGALDSVRVSDADSTGVRAMQSAFRSDIVHVLLAAVEPTSEVAWRGPGRLGGRDADVIEVTTAPSGAQPERSQLYLDAENHQLLGMDLGVSATKPGVYGTRRLYRDYRTVHGVLWPFYEERLIGGTRTMTILLDSVVLNSGVSDRTFAKPLPMKLGGPAR
jgi:hypothetical protein